MGLGEDGCPLLGRLEGGEDLAVDRGEVAEDPAGRRLALEGPGGVDDVDADREAVDLDGQGDRFPGLLARAPPGTAGPRRRSPEWSSET